MKIALFMLDCSRESLGFAIAYIYSGFLCMDMKLYLLLAYTTIAYAGYLIAFLANRHYQETVATRD